MLEKILTHYNLSSPVTECAPYGNGHINKTYCVKTADGQRYILQRLNTSVFAEPEAVMHNIELVTRHLSLHADDPRTVLTFVPTVDNASYCVTNQSYWRMFTFVGDSFCIDRADSPAQFAECAVGFARFFNQLRDFDAAKLTETIPHFHDTRARFSTLQSAIEKDVAGRVRNARREIEFALSYEDFAATLMQLQEAGELPLRVTHNDTKINNVLFDKRSGKCLCIVDLDTVMPGLIANDFGDAVRYGASTAAEDEHDLDRVQIDLTLYEAYLSAFLHTCGDALTPLERMLLPTGAKMMSYELGLRFLTDYLCGDSYFNIHYPEQNLYRARAQLKLASDIDVKWSELQRISKRCIAQMHRS